MQSKAIVEAVELQIFRFIHFRSIAELKLSYLSLCWVYCRIYLPSVAEFIFEYVADLSIYIYVVVSWLSLIYFIRRIVIIICAYLLIPDPLVFAYLALIIYQILKLFRYIEVSMFYIAVIRLRVIFILAYWVAWIYLRDFAISIRILINCCLICQ